MLLSLSLATVSGLILYGQEAKGPLAQATVISRAQADDDRQYKGNDEDEILEEVHKFLSHLALLLVLIHVPGVFLASQVEKQNLVRAMITGTKELPLEREVGI